LCTCDKKAAAYNPVAFGKDTALTEHQAAPPVSDGNGNNQGTPTSTGAYQAAPPLSDQANGNGNNPVGKEQIQTHAPTITYKSPSSNDMLMSLANITQPLCAAGICSQSYTNH